MDQDPQDPVNRQLWRHQPQEGKERLFLIPKGESLPPGDFQLTTRLGRERSIVEAAALPFEIPPEEAEAVLKAELGKVLEEGRQKLLDGLDKLHRKAREIPRDVQAAPEEQREAVAAAFEGLAAGLEKLSLKGVRRLRNAAGRIRQGDAETET